VPNRGAAFVTRGLSGHAQSLSDVGKSCFLGIAYLHTPNAEEGTLSRGLCHFLTDAAQPSFESNRVGRCLDIENCRDLLQIGERTFDALSRFRTSKAIAQGLLKGGPSFRRFNGSDDCLNEFVGTGV
jgi:hypothetical protein